MSATQALLGNSGTRHDIEHDGKTYKVSVINDKVMDQMEIESFRRARRLEEELRHDEAGRHLKALTVIKNHWANFAGLAKIPLPTEQDALAKHTSQMQLHADAINAALTASLSSEDEAYFVALTALNKRFERGEFSFESESGQEFLRSKSGMVAMAMAMLGCKSKMEAVQLIQAKGPEVSAMLALAVNESLGGSKKKGTDDPN